MINNLNCMLCGSDNHKLLFNAKDRLHGIEGTFTYVRCKNCGLVYMNPKITSEELTKFYPTSYAPHKIVKEIQSNALKRRFSTSSLVAGIKAFFFDHESIHYVPPLILNALNSDSKVLDIGCGNGTFLNDIKGKTGCQVMGVDISETAVLSARESYGLEIFKGTIEEVPFPLNSFDLITAWWSLVHVNNPDETLLKMATLLNDDGYLIVGVPNFNSFNARFFKNEWMHLDAPRHLCIHTPSTIKNMLEKNGFSVKKIIYDRNISGLFGSLQYRYYGSCIASEKLRLSPFAVKMLFVFNTLMSFLRLSDLLVVCAQKNR